MVQLNNYSWGHELLDLHQVKKKITQGAVFLPDLILGWGKKTPNQLKKQPGRKDSKKSK